MGEEEKEVPLEGWGCGKGEKSRKGGREVSVGRCGRLKGASEDFAGRLMY